LQSFTGTAGNYTKSWTFSKAFGATPIITLSTSGISDNCAVTASSATAFTVTCNASPNQVYWIAMSRTDQDNS
jgi:hypothetical protein